MSIQSHSVFKFGNGRSAMLRGAVLLLLTSACGKGSDADPDKAPVDCIKQESSLWSGFAYIGTDLKYTSSSLTYCDFATGMNKSLLTGEAGDAAMFWLDQKLFYFNRSSSSFNFRTMDPRDEQPAPTSQIAMTAGTPGDPSSAIALGSGKILLALGIAGGLAVIDSSTGSVDATALPADYVSSLDLVPATAGAGGGAASYPFRPSSLLTYNRDGKDYIAVTHLGLDVNYAATDTAQIFVLEKTTAGKLTSVDQDTAREKHQGIKLSYSNPSKFISLSATEFALVSLCNIATDCRQGIQTFNSTTNSVATSWDLSTEPFINNGTVKAGPDSQTIYAGVLFTSGEFAGKKSLVALNLKSKTWSVVHHFPSESSGCCDNVLFLSDTGTLLVSDEKPDGTGMFSIYDVSTGTPQYKSSIETSAAPRGTLLIPPKVAP